MLRDANTGPLDTQAPFEVDGTQLTFFGDYGDEEESD